VSAAVLVLGAYGLAGRAIVERLLRDTPHDIIASGRRPERLASEFVNADRSRLETRVLDATDSAALAAACAEARVVINAVGPYNRDGFSIARTVVHCGRHYVDCANEQIHYERLIDLDDDARAAEVLLVTAAGLIPGLSTLLAAHLLDRCPDANRIDIRYAQLRHAYADGGHASVMGGVLDAVYRPYAVRGGERIAVPLGQSTDEAELPPPFGPRRFLEVPNIDVPVLAALRPLRDIHTWIHLGDQPAWLFGLIRFLDPARRRWAYRLISAIVDRLTHAEFEAAAARGLGPDAFLEIEVADGGERQRAWLHFTDGASPTAVLPSRIACDLLAGSLAVRGLATPVGLYRWPEIEKNVQACVQRGCGCLFALSSARPTERPHSHCG